MIIDNKYTVPYTVPSTFIDGKCRCTAFSLISLAQDLASLHYGSAGLSIPHLQQDGLGWVITKQYFEIHEYPLWLDNLILETWAHKPRGPLCFRDFHYSFSKGGKHLSLDNALKQIGVNFSAEKLSPIMSAVSIWMVIDNKTKTVIKPDDTIMGSLSYCEENSLRYSFPKITLAETWFLETALSPSILDIDVNSHVNNLSYVRWILSFMDADFCRGKLLKNLQTYFVSSARFGEKLLCRCAPVFGETNTWLHSIIREDDGGEVFRAKSAWVPETDLCRELCAAQP